MGKLLCEKNLRDVWCRNESVWAEIGQILQTHRQTHASKLVVEIYTPLAIIEDRIHRAVCVADHQCIGSSCPHVTGVVKNKKNSFSLSLAISRERV